MPRVTCCKYTRKNVRNSHRQRNSKPTRTKRRGSDMKKILKGMLWSMEDYWKPIENKLKALGDKFKCVMCKATLPQTFEYKTVMSWLGTSSTVAPTSGTKLIVRKFNLSSALRSPDVRTSRNTFGTIQPTIFYFHCPYCAYVHQFKSSVLETADVHRRSSSRSSSRSNRTQEGRTRSAPL